MNLILSCCKCRVYGLKPPAAGKRAQTGAAPCIATARDFVCQTVLKKRRAPAPAAGAAAGPAPAAAPDPNPAGAGPGARGGSAERGKAAPPLHLFHDEGLNSFFRRLAWSPEGAHPALARPPAWRHSVAVHMGTRYLILPHMSLPPGAHALAG